MKKIVIYLIAAIGLVVSCAEDKGNYDYSEINKITQTGLKEEYTVERYSELFIACPELAFSEMETADLSYDWRVNYKTVSTEKDLKAVITAELGSRRSCLIITENKTGVKHFFEFITKVTTNYANGIHFLIEKENGDASLTFMRRGSNLVSDNFTYDVFAFENPQLSSLGRKPKMINYTSASTSSNIPYLYVLSHEGDNRITKIDKNTMKLKIIMNQNTILGGSDLDFKPDFMCNMTASPVMSNGKLYMHDFMGSGSLYRAARGDYNLAPYAYTDPTYVFMHWFAYDMTKSQFLMLTNDADNDTFTFDVVKPMGGDKVAAGSILKIAGQVGAWSSDDYMSSSSTFSALLYNTATGKGDLYEHLSMFEYDSNWNPSVTNTITYKKSIDVVDANSLYAFSKASGHAYIVTGNKIYKMYYKDSEPELLWTSTTGNITAISLNGSEKGREDLDLFVSTYNASSSNAKKGSFYIINTDTKQVMETYENKIDKCVSLCWVR